MVTLSLGTKKKSYPSIKAAALVVASQTNEPVERVYMRMYMRLRAGKKPVTAVKQKARKYTMNKQQEIAA